MSADFEAVTRVVNEYFDALYDGDHAAIARMFHKKSRIFTFRDGALVELDIETYVGIVKGRDAPAKLGSPRKDELISIALTTPVSATATVRLILFKNDFSDQLSLIKDEGRWQIMTKIYHLNGVLA